MLRSRSRIHLGEGAIFTFRTIRAVYRGCLLYTSYNLLWGQLALTIFLVACAVLAVKQRLGL